MPKTRLISPGSIPNHKLLKNLQLQGNYISNDGGDEGIAIDDAGDVGINMPSGISPAAQLEVFGDTQYSTGTAYQSSTAVVGSGTTFTTAMVGGRLIFDDGTDAGTVVGFIATTVLTVSIGQTVGASDDLRSYKIYYAPIQIKNDSTLGIGVTTLSESEYDVSSGDFTLDVAGDINLDAGGNDINFQSAGTTLATLTLGSGIFKMFNPGDTGDYIQIQTTSAGLTNFTTVDDSGNNDAAFNLAPQGYITLQPAANKPLNCTPVTKTASGTTDSTMKLAEILNLSSGAGGSDIHYGLWYAQTQTDLTGWDSVYLMYLTGGTAAKSLVVQGDGKVGIGVTDPASPLEVFSTSSQLKLSYDASNYADISVASDGHLELATTGSDADLTLDIDGDLFIDLADGNISMSKASGVKFYFDMDSHTLLEMRSLGLATDMFKIQVNAEGATTITTVDTDTAAAHLTIVADGHVEFDGCGVGFDKIAATFGASAVIGDPNDSTDIDFRLGNKYELELTDSLGAPEKLNFIFPATSGNFLIVLIQDGSGSRTIHADSWTAYQSDGSTEATNVAGADGTDGDLRWAGGSAPTLTTTADKSDIVSIYWDADNQTAFAVISQNF